MTSEQEHDTLRHEIARLKDGWARSLATIRDKDREIARLKEDAKHNASERVRELESLIDDIRILVQDDE